MVGIEGVAVVYIVLDDDCFDSLRRCLRGEYIRSRLSFWFLIPRCGQGGQRQHQNQDSLHGITPSELYRESARAANYQSHRDASSSDAILLREVCLLGLVGAVRTCSKAQVIAS